MIELKKLPYEIADLEPYIDQKTVEFHYTKHHQGYVDKLNSLIKGTEFEDMSLKDIVLKSSGTIFNNAAQIWNHDFYRNCLKSPIDGRGDQIATEDLNIIKKILQKWGNFDNFKEEFNNLAVGNFGSGWTWLVKNQSGELEITNTSNANCPITKGFVPLLVVDVWEHAYYLGYQNRRLEYLANWRNLINWKSIDNNLGEISS